MAMMPRLEVHPLAEEVSLFAGAAAVEEALVATSMEEVDGLGEATGAWEISSWAEAVASSDGIDTFVVVDSSDEIDGSEEVVEALLVASSVGDDVDGIDGTLVSILEAEVTSKEEL